MSTWVRRELEFHDACLSAVLTVGDQVIIILRVYVHQHETSDLAESHTGWVQAVAFVFGDGVIEACPPIEAYPSDVSTGRLTVRDTPTPGLAPVPYSSEEAVALPLVLTDGSELRVRGNSLTLSEIGLPHLVEVIP